jgi:hypothetical protein
LDIPDDFPSQLCAKRLELRFTAMDKRERQ